MKHLRDLPIPSAEQTAQLNEVYESWPATFVEIEDCHRQTSKATSAMLDVEYVETQDINYDLWPRSANEPIHKWEYRQRVLQEATKAVHRAVRELNQAVLETPTGCADQSLLQSLLQIVRFQCELANHLVKSGSYHSGQALAQLSSQKLLGRLMLNEGPKSSPSEMATNNTISTQYADLAGDAKVGFFRRCQWNCQVAVHNLDQALNDLPTAFSFSELAITGKKLWTFGTRLTQDSQGTLIHLVELANKTPTLVEEHHDIITAQLDAIMSSPRSHRELLQAAGVEDFLSPSTAILATRLDSEGDVATDAGDPASDFLLDDTTIDTDSSSMLPPRAIPRKGYTRLLLRRPRPSTKR